MHRTKVLRLIDIILDRKCQTDVVEIAISAGFRSFTRRISDYLIKKLGSAKRREAEISAFSSRSVQVNLEGNSVMCPADTSHLSSDRESGTTVIMMLKPGKTQSTDYILFLLCYNITKPCKKTENMFQRADPERKGTLMPSEFASRIASVTKIWIRQNDLKAALTIILQPNVKTALKDFFKLVKIDQLIQLRTA